MEYSLRHAPGMTQIRSQPEVKGGADMHPFDSWHIFGQTPLVDFD